MPRKSAWIWKLEKIASLFLQYTTILCQHTEWQKYTEYKNNVPLWDCPYLCHVLTDFHNFFTDAFCGQLAIKWSLSISPHFNCVATLPCEIKMQGKLTISCKRVGEQNTPPTKMKWMMRVMLHFVRSFSLGIWGIECLFLAYHDMEKSESGTFFWDTV